MIPWQFLPVHPALQSIVENILYINADFKASGLLSELKYPWVAATHLYFTIGDEKLLVKNKEEENFVALDWNIVVGPKMMTNIINLGTKRHAVGITFRPGGLQRLSGIPLNEIVNLEIDATAIFGNEINVIHQQLKEAAGKEKILQIITAFLLKRLNSISYNLSPFDQSIGYLIQHNGSVSIEELADLSGFSLRQFERHSLKNLGISPKLFARLTRFSKAYIRKEMFPQQKWASLCYEFGYSDQMHLIHEFKKFSGYTPSAIDAMLPTSMNLMSALSTSKS